MPRIYSRNAAGAVAEVDTVEVVQPHATRVSEFSRMTTNEDRDAENDREAEFARFELESVIDESNLRAPTARPGHVQRWIRDGSVDIKDNAHWFKRMRQGWSPRDPATVPQNYRHLFAQAKLADGTSVIRVAGLVLCEMPINVARAREAAVKEMISRQTRAVPPSAAQLRGGEAFGPVRVAEDNERVTRGRRAATMVE